MEEDIIISNGGRRRRRRSITDLLEGIIHHILSFMTTKQAAIGVASLSKDFYRAFRTVPTLVYGFESSDHRSELHHMISTLLSLPEQVLQLKSQVELSPRGCSLMDKTVVFLPNLKCLHLCEVYLDESEFQNMVKSCPLIEIFHFSCCACYRRIIFKVNNLQNIKQLRVDLVGNQRIEVETAPNLELFYVNSSAFPRISLNAHQYPRLKTLSICNERINGGMIFDFSRKFPQLSSVSIIKFCLDLRRIRISGSSCNNLQQAKQLDDPTFDLFEHEFRPMIRRISLAHVSGWCESRLKVSRQDVDTSWFSELKEFLMRLQNGSEVYVALPLTRDVVFDLNALRKKSTPSEAVEVAEFFF